MQHFAGKMSDNPAAATEEQPTSGKGSLNLCWRIALQQMGRTTYLFDESCFYVTKSYAAYVFQI